MPPQLIDPPAWSLGGDAQVGEITLQDKGQGEDAVALTFHLDVDRVDAPGGRSRMADKLAGHGSGRGGHG